MTMQDRRPPGLRSRGSRQVARPAPPPSGDSIFLAEQEMAGVEETTSEDIFDVVDGQQFQRGRSADGRQDEGVVEHTTGRLVQMYKPMPNGTYRPVPIPFQNLKLVMSQGFRPYCPDCVAAGLSREQATQCDGKNGCAGRTRRAFRRCPQCGKQIFDDPVAYRSLGQEVSEADDDEMEIRDDAYATATPQTRTKALLDRHIIAYHPAEAGFLGVTALPVRADLPAQMAEPFAAISPGVA